MPGFMTALITTLHILGCIGLVVAILLQSGRGGGLAGTFGAGSSQTLFGGRGAATFLTRAATTLAVIFFLTSLTLGLTASRQAGLSGRSLIQEEARRRAGQRAPGEPASPTSPPMGGGMAPGQGMTPPSTPATGTPQTPAPGTSRTPAPTTGTQTAPPAAPSAPSQQGTEPAPPPATEPSQQAPAPQGSGTP